MIPKDKKIWVFGSSGGSRFADNAKWLFLYCSKNVKQVRCVWISREQEVVEKIRRSGKLQAHNIRSWKGLYYSLRANVCFFDHSLGDIDIAACRGARKVQLWHGVALKKILNDSIPLNLKEIFCSKEALITKYHLSKRLSYYIHFPIVHKHDLIVSTGEKMTQISKTAFRTKRGKIIETGLPRNDILLRNSNGRTENHAEIRKIGYLPTFRDNGIRTFPDHFPIEEISNYLKATQAQLFVKMHRVENLSSHDLQEEDASAIKIVESAADPYPLLRTLDLLITDYSSIMFDFLLLDRPIILYAYDYDEYVTRNRALYWNFEEVAPGPIVDCEENLVEAVKKYSEMAERGQDPWKEKRNQVRRMFFKFVDSKASQRVVKSVFERFYE